MITLDVDEATIRARWAEVLERRNCMEIYEYLYAVIYERIVIIPRPHVPNKPESFGLSLWPASPSSRNMKNGSRGIQIV